MNATTTQPTDAELFKLLDRAVRAFSLRCKGNFVKPRAELVAARALRTTWFDTAELSLRRQIDKFLEQTDAC